MVVTCDETHLETVAHLCLVMVPFCRSLQSCRELAAHTLQSMKLFASSSKTVMQLQLIHDVAEGIRHTCHAFHMLF